MTTYEEMGKSIVANVPFMIDPDDNSKFILDGDGRSNFMENVFHAAVNSLRDYGFISRYREDKMACFKEVMDVNKKAYEWVYKYIQNNYPGAKIDDELETFLIVVLTEFYSDDKDLSMHKIATEIIEAIQNSDDSDLKEQIKEHINLIKERDYATYLFKRVNSITTGMLGKLLAEGKQKEIIKKMLSDLDLLIDGLEVSNLDLMTTLVIEQKIVLFKSFLCHLLYRDHPEPVQETIMQFIEEPNSFLDNFKGEEDSEDA